MSFCIYFRARGYFERKYVGSCSDRLAYGSSECRDAIERRPKNNDGYTTYIFLYYHLALTSKFKSRKVRINQYRKKNVDEKK